MTLSENYSEIDNPWFAWHPVSVDSYQNMQKIVWGKWVIRHRSVAYNQFIGNWQYFLPNHPCVDRDKLIKNFPWTSKLFNQQSSNNLEEKK